MPALLAALVLAACAEPEGPPVDVVRQIAESLFERAARGEALAGVNIPFTGQGPATPKLTRTEVLTRRPTIRKEMQLYEYDVKLTYLNRIAQLENATIRVRIRKKDNVWMSSFADPTPRR